MGNKPIKIGLQLEKAKYQAGETISGKVFLSANQVDKEVSGVHLQLLGVEHVEIREDTNEGYSRTHGSTHTIIKSEYPLVNGGIQSTGHFEYKFNWKIPPELPGSLHCCHDDQSTDGRNTSFCEISYTLTAYVANSRNPFTLPDNSDRRSTVALHIIQHAAPPPTTTLHHRQPPPALVMDTDVFPIAACCIWDRGSIHLGFQADTARASPGETVQVLCWGQNKSRLEIEFISAKVVETVTWKTHDNTHTDTTKRVLVEERLSVRAYAQWQSPATRKAYHSVKNESLNNNNNNNSVDSSSPALTFNLALPSYARDTVAGRLIQVRHVLVVMVVTAGGFCTTSPEMACAIQIVPAASNGELILDVVPASSDTPGRLVPEYDPNQHLLVEVQALPDDWHPIEVGIITLPQASVIMLDDEERVQSSTLPNTVPALRRRMPQSASLTSTSTTNIASSAPDESLLFDAGRSSLPITPKLEHLLSLASEDPTTIPVVLEDPGWQAVIQSLTPRDYSSLVKAASGDSLQHQQTTSTAPCVVVARALAMRMGKYHFQSRHILACLWALHDEADRIQVLCAIAPLASDLLTTRNNNNNNNNRTMIEQELNAVELASFRAALAALQ